MLRIRQNYLKRPPAGWRYVDPRTEVVIEAEDDVKLVAAVRRFRQINGFAVGDPEADVVAYYAKHYPDFVEQAPPPAYFGASSGIYITTAEDRMEQWLLKLSAKPPTQVLSAKQSVNRIATCKACPWHRPWTADLDNPQDVAIHRKLWVLSQGLFNPALGYCSKWRASAALLCVLKAEQFPGGEPMCWIGKPDELVEDVLLR